MLSASPLRLLMLSCAVLGCTPEATPPAPPALAELPPLPEVEDATPAPRGPERPVRELTLALVGEVRGEIAPCGCPTLPYGGFARRQRLLDRLRSQERLVHLDAGELLLKGVSTDREEDREARAEALLKLSATVGVDAWSPGPTDLLALGVEGALRAARRSDVPPMVSASWARADGSLLFPAARVVERDGVKVGVIGLSTGSGAPELRALQTLPPEEAVARGLAALDGEDVDLVVVLGSVSDEAADRVAALSPRIGAVLSTKGRQLDPVRQPGAGPTSPWPETALVMEAADRGRYLSLLRLRLGSTPEAPLRLLPGEQDWKDLHTARRQVTVLETEASEVSPEALERVRTELAAREAAMEEAGRGRNLASGAEVPLAEDLDGPSPVAEIVAGFEREAVLRAASRAAAPPPPTATGYAASSACISCHTAEFARWSGTDHAQAWASLVARGNRTGTGPGAPTAPTENPDCVGCHSTGFGEPGGFGELTAANVRRFKAVQCEACHGPLAGHPEAPDVHAKPMGPARCTGCHDPANSPGFDYDSYLRRATCQGGAPELMAPPVAIPAPSP
jgi:hypothetical protein